MSSGKSVRVKSVEAKGSFGWESTTCRDVEDGRQPISDIQRGGLAGQNHGRIAPATRWVGSPEAARGWGRVRPRIANTGDADLIFLAIYTLRFAGTGDEDMEPIGRVSAASAGAVRQFQATIPATINPTETSRPALAGSP